MRHYVVFFSQAYGRHAPDPYRHTLHRKSLAVLEEIRSLLELYGRSCNNGCLKLEININHGVPARLTHCQETRKDIPLEDIPLEDRR